MSASGQGGSTTGMHATGASSAGGSSPMHRDTTTSAGAEVHAGLHGGAGDVASGTGSTGGQHTGAIIVESESYGAIAFSKDAQVGSSQTGGSQGSEGLQQKVMNRVGSVADTVKSRAQDLTSNLGERATELAGQARERAGEMTGQAKEKLGVAYNRAESMLEERGVLDQVRQNPLPALGIAFGLGFLMAGSGGGIAGNNKTVLKAKNQIKGAVVGGLSAAIAQEARSLIGMAESSSGGRGGQSGGLLGSLLQSLQGSSGSSSGSSSRGGSGRMGSSGGGGTVHREPSHRELA